MTHIAGAVDFFRAARVSRRTSTCLIKRTTGTVLNPTTLVLTPTYVTQYSGPCLIRPASVSAVNSGQRQVELKFYYVDVSYDETDPLPDDLVDISASPDAFFVGKQFVVRNIEGDDWNVKRYLWCEEVVGG